MFTNNIFNFFFHFRFKIILFLIKTKQLRLENLHYLINNEVNDIFLLHPSILIISYESSPKLFALKLIVLRGHYKSDK